MKKFLSILLSVTMLMTILPATFAFAEFSGEPMVLEVQVLEGTEKATEIKAGDTITVNINYASGFSYTDGVMFTLKYNTAHLTLVSSSAKTTSKLPGSQINAATAGKIIYVAASNGDPVEFGANETIATAQFTVNSLAAKDISTTFEITDVDCTCTDIIDNEGDAVYPQLGGGGNFEPVSVPCLVNNKTIIINPKSSDATLKTLKYGGTSVTLEEGKYDYAGEVPYGTTVMPEVTYETNDANATATASTTDGVTTIVVTAENGTTKQTYTLTITVAEKLYTLIVGAVNGTIKATYSDKVDEDWDAAKTAEFSTGTVIKLEATAEEGATFLYWRDNISGRVVSYNTLYTVTVGTNKDITAVFVEENSYVVEFVGVNNKIYTSSTANLDITVPKDPYILGYTFRGWAIDGIKVDEYVAGYVIPAGTFTANTTIFAMQEVEETTYTVTIINAQENLSGKYKFNDEIKVKPSEELKNTGKFKCWMRDGQIVSYDEEYRFYVGNYNTTVEAVFVGAGEEVEAKPVISMAAPTIVAGNKISFMMERKVPNGYKVVEAGILMKKGYIADGDENPITLDNYDYKGTSANTAEQGFYTARKGNVKPYEWWSAVGYLIYKDTDGKTQTIYSSHVRGWIEAIGEGGLEDAGEL